ncbi:MAG: ABC transporter ATP-binding protein [Nitrososphaerota archaeon]|nr:ABC transporter ATP-binding protein [Nitrososphaerota archaeon]MDG7024202.1 ABC transporter ATP-binding protein [Nitrososphaerota archaeon]
MLKVEGISAGYGRLQILTDVSLEAPPGEITVVVGPNGSGKSTLLKSIAGLTSIYRGTVSMDGRTLSGHPPHAIARMGLAYLPQTESVFTQLTVSENFKMAAYMVSGAEFRARLEDSLEIFPQLKAYLGSKVVNLSGGERQMVAMTMALLRKPRAILFDEPTANLSPKYSTEVLNTVHALGKERGLTIVLVEQNARRALEMGDRAYLLVGGKNAFMGTSQELLSHQELAKLYLGMKVAQA